MGGLLGRIAVIAIAVPVFAVSGPLVSHAQSTPDSSNPVGLGAFSRRTVDQAKANAGKQRVSAPPVLPGTKGASEPAAPGALPADASPNDVMFDAINRGDIATARDAINRGANLDAVNVLGQTPLELSVDLGRNDITFLLLSAREGDSTSRQVAREGRGPGGSAEAAPPEPKPAVTRRAPRAYVPAADEPDERVARAPRLYSGGGGTAIPSAGFLGFDRASR